MLLHTPNPVRNKNLWLNNWKKPANPSPILKIYMNINMLKTLRRSAIKNPSNHVQWFSFPFLIILNLRTLVLSNILGVIRSDGEYLSEKNLGISAENNDKIF